jgi:hypothetical protein
MRHAHGWYPIAQFAFERFWQCAQCGLVAVWSAALGVRTPPARWPR